MNSLPRGSHWRSPPSETDQRIVDQLGPARPIRERALRPAIPCSPRRGIRPGLARCIARLLHVLPHSHVAERLPAWVGEKAWTVLRTAVQCVRDIAEWEDVVRGDISVPDLPPDDRSFLAEAAALAESIDWAGEPWAALTGALKDRTGRKGKPLFLPLRLALTGRTAGPEMAPLVKLIGKASCLARLNAASA